MEKEDPTNYEFYGDRKAEGAAPGKGLWHVWRRRRHEGLFPDRPRYHRRQLRQSRCINAKGELIGIAFDGNWEAMSGDIAFEPAVQRTINVDIRYVLFIIDKFAGAGHLVEEMDVR
jgi:hypothetical protein